MATILPRCLGLVLRDGMRLGHASIRLETIGALRLSTGKVVATDPLTSDGRGNAFVERFPIGRYDVALTLLEDDRYDRPGEILAATILFSRETVASWEIAKTELGSTAYGVDAGTGCFVDLAAASRLRDSATADVILRGRSGARSQVVSLDAERDLDAVVFDSGVGDGVYATWIGRDEAGTVVALTTDFRSDQLEPLRIGGPWDEPIDPANALFELCEFSRKYGAPTDAWCAARTFDRAAVQRLWDACESGTMLRSLLRGADDDVRRRVAGSMVERAGAMIESVVLDELRASLEAISGALASGAKSNDELELALGDLLIEALRVARGRGRIDPDARWRAAVDARAYVDPRAALRELDRRLDREEAARIRAIVPEAPTLEELVASAKTRRPRRS